jgi:hypothetical protein
MGFHGCHLCAGFHREIWWLYAGGEVRWLQVARGKHYRILDELQRVSFVKDYASIPDTNCCLLDLSS